MFVKYIFKNENVCVFLNIYTRCFLRIFIILEYFRVEIFLVFLISIFDKIYVDILIIFKSLSFEIIYFIVLSKASLLNF